MLYKVTTERQVLWILRHAVVIQEPGKPDTVKHLSSFARRWRLQMAAACNNPITCPSNIERKILYLTFGPQLRAVGGIK